MGNSFSSITGNAAGILKIAYQGALVSQFNQELPFYREIDKGTEKYQGQQVNRSLKVQRNPGMGATTDGGPLPVIGNQGTTQAIITAKYNYLRAGVTGPALKAAASNKGAFISLMDLEMTQGLEDCKWNVGRQLLWDGTGALATVSVTAVASSTITLAGRESTESAGKFIFPGLVVDIYTAAGVLVQSGITILTVATPTASTSVVTLNQVVSTTATDIIVGTNCFNNEIQGLLYSMGTTQSSTIYGVDRTAYPQYQSNVINNSGGQLTLDVMQQAWNAGRERGGAKFDYVCCDFTTERYYNKLLVPDKRFVGKVAGDGTFSDKNGSYLEFGGIPMVPDQTAPTRLFFIDSTQFKKYELCMLEWADEQGSVMFQQISADAFELRLRLFTNIFPEKPAAQAVVRNYISP